MVSGAPIVELNDQNYKAFLEENEAVFLQFYSPGCQFCKKLKPVFEELAERLAKSLPLLRFAKINAQKEIKAKEKFEIRGYPVLILMLGESKLYYNGERNLKNMEQWLLARMDPQIQEVTSLEEVERLKKGNKIFLYLFPVEDVPVNFAVL